MGVEPVITFRRANHSAMIVFTLLLLLALLPLKDSLLARALVVMSHKLMNLEVGAFQAKTNFP